MPLSVLLLNGCAGNNTPDNTKNGTAAAEQPNPIPGTPPPTTDTAGVGDYQCLYITIADTGLSYYKLRAVMAKLNTNSHIRIDTMNRYYNAAKNEIVLRDDDEDEMYRGTYAPRRFPSESLSLEYAATYTRATAQKNIALVAGIYETKQSADSMLKVIKPFAGKAFVLKGEVYVGCMH